MELEYLSWRASRHNLLLDEQENKYTLCDATTGEVIAENRTREQLYSTLNYLDRKKFGRSYRPATAKTTRPKFKPQAISLF